ncbi:MAG: peptidase U34 [Spirochaetae bacterium HGW-Spirochaetae-1]|jgi:dipeptidase|nr:MAG: peptidase U34 [Spirochaetae bacterium HGW-Spirochaetae-1]
MCDTLIATPSVTARGEMILGKNSDREPNEAQNITYIPARTHNHGTVAQYTYIQIPQVRHTYAVFLSRPFWMPGAEMGVNEHGVAIGNEAVYSKEPYAKTGLTGMDLLRLALERATTAKEAYEVILSLISQHGQGGNCAMEGKLYYHNSYIIADPRDAYVLETADRLWVLKKVITTASISNSLSIEDDFTKTSPGLEDYARKKGYTGKNERLNFSRDFSDTIFTHFGRGHIRHNCSTGLLSAGEKSITALDMMRYLRDHNAPEPFMPGKKHMERICMHGGGFIAYQSTGSMVAVLRDGQHPLIYFTGTSAPCVSLFKPHAFPAPGEAYVENHFSSQSDQGMDIYGSAGRHYDPATLWWTGEDIHRRVLMNYPELAPSLQAGRDALEKDMTALMEEEQNGKDSQRFHRKCADLTEKLLSEHARMARNVKERYKAIKKINAPLLFRLHWGRINRKARFLP